VSDSTKKFPKHDLAQALAERSKRGDGFSWRPLVYSVLLLLVLGFASTFLVVFAAVFREEPEFVAVKTIYLPQRELEHRMRLQEFQQAAAPPVMLQTLSTEALMPDALPPMPPLPRVEMGMQHSDHFLGPANALLGQAGLLAGIGELATEASTIRFFGMEDQATRVVIAFDVSQSVKTKVERAGLSMTHVRDETARLIEGLNANTLFGFVQFSRNYDVFRPYLIAATLDNKAAAQAWLQSEFRTDGRSGRGWSRGRPNGIQSVIQAIFSLDPAPDLIILVSDGDFQRNTTDGRSEDVPWEAVTQDLRDLQDVLPTPARLSFVGFHMKPGDQSAVNRLVRRYHGRVREVE